MTVLFSRDLRTFHNFRLTWINYFIERNHEIVYINRRDSSCLLVSFFHFISFSKRRRFIFGTSEILLYSFFSKSNDVLIFTGIGRLFTESPTIIKVLLFSYIKFFYKNQIVLVLNRDDQNLMSMHFKNVFLLPGEGYNFEHKICIKRPNRLRKNLKFAYVGRLLKSKGVDRLLIIFSKFSSPQDELLILGDFDFSNSDALTLDFLHHVQSISKGKIIHLGYVIDVKEVLKNVDCYISFSKREGLPFGVLDGVAAGCVCLLSWVPGHKEFFEINGCLFFNSEEEFIRIFRNRDLLFGLDQTSTNIRRKIVNEKFGIRAFEETLDKIFDLELTQKK